MVEHRVVVPATRVRSSFTKDFPSAKAFLGIRLLGCQQFLQSVE